MFFFFFLLIPYLNFYTLSINTTHTRRLFIMSEKNVKRDEENSWYEKHTT